MGIPFPSTIQALWLWLAAAQQGYVNAQNALADEYAASGRMKSSHEWRLVAAEQGLVQAQFAVGAEFLTGTGCGQDLTAARVWLSKAAAQDYPGALELLQDPKHFPVKG